MLYFLKILSTEIRHVRQQKISSILVSSERVLRLLVKLKRFESLVLNIAFKNVFGRVSSSHPHPHPTTPSPESEKHVAV